MERRKEDQEMMENLGRMEMVEGGGGSRDGGVEALRWMERKEGQEMIETLGRRVRGLVARYGGVEALGRMESREGTK